MRKIKITLLLCILLGIFLVPQAVLAETHYDSTGNEEYKSIDKLIDEKVKYLNSIPIYQEYLRRMKEFNSCLSESSNTIEKYINDKV